MTNEQKITRATNNLRMAVRAILKQCKKKYGYVPEPQLSFEHEYIFGDSDHENHEDACQFLWDSGIEAPLLEFLGETG